MTIKNPFGSLDDGLSREQQIRNTVLPIGPLNNVKVAALFFKYVVPISFSKNSKLKRIYPPFMRDEKYKLQSDSMTHDLTMSGLIAAMFEAGYTDIIVEEKDHLIAYDGHPIYGSGYVPKEGCDDAIGFALLEMIENNTRIPTPGISPGGASLDTNKMTPIREVIFDHNFTTARSPIYGCDLLGRTEENVNSVLVTLSNVPWVDLTSSPWEQILEFREDPDSIKKFRNFRLFVSESYTDKDPHFIEDDFLKRLDDFEITRKKHGFHLQNSTIKTVVKSKYILAGGLSGLLAWLFDPGQAADIVGSAALISGVSVEMASTLLDIRAANFDIKHEIEGNELAYVIKARDELGKPTANT